MNRLQMRLLPTFLPRPLRCVSGQPFQQFAALVLGTLLAGILCGCAGEKERLALESRLRESDATIRELREEVNRSNQLLADQDAELEVMRDSGSGEVASLKTVSSTVETAAAWGSVASIQIQTLTSGLITTGSQPVVNVVIQPLDDDGELVKVAGRLTVTVSAISPEGSSNVIAERDVSLSESRQSWTRSLVSSGFHIQLPVTTSVLPGHKLLLAATLNLGRDRDFSTSELISPVEQ